MRHPVFARVYAHRLGAEGPRQDPFRRELVAGLSGRVLEIGCGTGPNFAFYPPAVTEVVGVEPEPYLRRLAARAPSTVARTTVVDGRAETVAGAVRGLFDAVVFSLVLCSVADPVAVLEEVGKVLRPGASIRLFEHVVSGEPRLARRQRRAAPLWCRLAGGCRPDRDLVAAIGGEVVIEDLRAFALRPGGPLGSRIVEPHILARAVLVPTPIS